MSGSHNLFPNALPSQWESRDHFDCGSSDARKICCGRKQHRGCCCSINGCPAPRFSSSLPRPRKAARRWLWHDHCLTCFAQGSVSIAFFATQDSVDLSSLLRHREHHRPPSSYPQQSIPPGAAFLASSARSVTPKTVRPAVFLRICLDHQRHQRIVQPEKRATGFWEGATTHTLVLI